VAVDSLAEDASMVPGAAAVAAAAVVITVVLIWIGVLKDSGVGS